MTRYGRMLAAVGVVGMMALGSTVVLAQSRGAHRGDGGGRPAAHAVPRPGPGPSMRPPMPPPPPARNYGRYNNYEHREYYRPAPYYYGYPRYPYPYPYAGWGVTGRYRGFGFTYVHPVAPTVDVYVSPMTAQGVVLFETDALDAAVYVDGRFVGTIESFTHRPLTLLAGQHEISVVSRGQNFPFRVMLEPGQTVRLRAAF